MTFSSESDSAFENVSCLPTEGVHKNIDYGNKKYFCDFENCSAKFSRPWRLEAHRNIHVGVKPFPCDYPGCNKAYTTNFHLRRHKVTAHKPPSSEKPYRCEKCQKEFTLVQNLKKHIRRTHVEVICPVCNEKFDSHPQFKKHQKLHFLGSNFKCQDCGAVFDNGYNYNRHLRGHRLHTCPVKGCKIASRNWSFMRKHLTSHPYDFICAYCKRGYRYKKHIEAHIIRHMTGTVRKTPFVLKKYKCELCEKEILGKTQLKRHKKAVHEKPENPEPQTKKKERAPRKDKGVPKRALAAILSEVIIPKEVEKQLIEEGLLIDI